MSELDLVLRHLKQPEYIHVLLNPLPVYATAMGVLSLILALLLRSEQARTVAFVIVIVACGSVWPVVRYGHGGYDRVYAMSNADAQQWLDVHERRAEQCQYVFYLTGLLAIAGLIAQRKFPKASYGLTVATLALAIVCLSLGGWISHAGGQVRHSEFREGPPPVPAERHDHADEHEHTH